MAAALWFQRGKNMTFGTMSCSWFAAVFFRDDVSALPFVLLNRGHFLLELIQKLVKVWILATFAFSN